MTTQFNNWLDTLVDEKNINREEVLTVKGQSGDNFIPVEVVIEHIKIASKQEQEAIRNVLVKLDFLNQPIVPFFKHLAQAIAR